MLMQLFCFLRGKIFISWAQSFNVLCWRDELIQAKKSRF